MKNHINKKIFWIASYPKSGNTWMRAILLSLFFTKDGIFNFKLFNQIRYFDTPGNYEFIKSLNLDDFKNLNDLSTIAKYWIEAQKRTIITDGNFSFYKTHSANIKINEYKYTSEDTTLGLIYIVRDPRDIALSYAKHKGVSTNEIIDLMKNEKILTSSGGGYPVVLSSWNHHYYSWVHLNVPKIIIRYEDLLEKTEMILWKLIDFFNINYKIKFNSANKIINNILLSTSFEKFQEYEKINGFPEATTNSMFFRKGKKNQWEKALKKYQLNKIENSFKSPMKEINYL